MTRRQVFWPATAAGALAAAIVLIPGSPVYLPRWCPGIDPYGGRSARSCLAAMKSTDPEVRHRAIFTLGTMHADGAEAVPALSAVLRDDPDVRDRGEAALALYKMAPASRGAVPDLARGLDDKEAIVRMNSALALYKLGKESRPAVPALIRAVNNDANENNVRIFTFTIRMMAAKALGRASSGTADGVPALTTALESSSNVPMTVAVTCALGDVGPEARAAVPRLRKLLKDDSKYVRQAAEDALGKIETAPGDS